MLTTLKEIVNQPENRATFFSRIRRLYPEQSKEYQEIYRAYNAAKDGFREKYRDDGERVFEHARRVTIIMIDYLYIADHRVIIAGLLHDVVEDLKFWTVQRVVTEFNQYSGYLVECMTKLPKDLFPGGKTERNDVYHGQFVVHPRDFFYIKLADRMHNLLTMWCWEAKDIKRKLEETKLYYLPHAKKHCILAHEIQAAIDELEEKINAEGTGISPGRENAGESGEGLRYQSDQTSYEAIGSVELRPA